MIKKLGPLSDWLDEQNRSGALWYVKRLSGNDTLANESHQAGPYVPKNVLFSVFPFEVRKQEKNPDFNFDLTIDSHLDCVEARAVWYNGKVTGLGTRNEARLTNFGGASSALLDPESTGSLTVFVFHRNEDPSKVTSNVWVCDELVEEDLIEERIGPVEPDQALVIDVDDPGLFSDPIPKSSCWLPREKLPGDWLEAFPGCEDLIRFSISMRDDAKFDVDERLIRRRKCEYQLFQSLEEAVELPKIQKGFGTIGEFVSHAQSILQRRRSRSGRSLELHLREILLEENFEEGKTFSYQAETEKGSRPDFIFPSVEAYHDSGFPRDRLRMLAVKNTLKERWPQILEEAADIKIKHLLTLQEGVSEAQFQKLTDANVRLVVPAKLHESFADSIKPHLIGLESFVGDLRASAP